MEKPGMAGIELRGVSKVFSAGNRALEGLDLAVGSGELVVLVGPSGSGKTTVLRLVAGLDRPTTGSIWRDGQDLRCVPPQRRDVAMVFQQHGLYGRLSARRNIAFALELRGGRWLSALAGNWLARSSQTDIDRQVHEAARLVGVEPLLERTVGELSGGERQRVALARTIARRPQTWLMDEPLASLDAPGRLALRQEIRDLQRKLGTTTIYVTHDQVEAMALADRIGVLDRGRLQQLGTPYEVYNQPQNIFVATFFGAQGMNLLSGTLQDTNRGLQFQYETGSFPLPAALYDKLLPHSKESLIVGIRPDAIVIDNPSEATGLTATFIHTEYLGDSHLIELQMTPAVRWFVRGDQPPPLACGAVVGLRLPAERLHWFLAATGQRLPAGAQTGTRESPNPRDTRFPES